MLVTVTVFWKFPMRWVSYLTLMDAFSPGAMGVLGQMGTVQPHEPTQLVMIRGSLPVFLKVNSRSPFDAFLITP